MNDVERCISEWVDRVNERDATIAALTKELEQEKQNAFGLAAAQCDDPIPGEYGYKLCGTVMEKDRQIAALQAERDEYKTMYVCLTGETYDNPIAALKDQLTQRTAELSRRTDECNEISKMYVEVQAELERVRGERDEDNKIGLPVIVELLRQADKGQDGPLSVLKGIIAERDLLRTLLLALPKVEGEIEVICHERNGVLWWDVVELRTDGNAVLHLTTRQDGADKFAALLQHRQRVEG